MTAAILATGGTTNASLKTPHLDSNIAATATTTSTSATEASAEVSGHQQGYQGINRGSRASAGAAGHQRGQQGISQGIRASAGAPGHQQEQQGISRGIRAAAGAAGHQQGHQSISEVHGSHRHPPHLGDLSVMFRRWGQQKEDAVQCLGWRGFGQLQKTSRIPDSRLCPLVEVGEWVGRQVIRLQAISGGSNIPASPQRCQPNVVRST